MFFFRELLVAGDTVVGIRDGYKVEKGCSLIRVTACSSIESHHRSLWSSDINHVYVAACTAAQINRLTGLLNRTLPCL